MSKNNNKTEWNLKLFYKSMSDPQIEKDTVMIEDSYADFERRYKDRTDYMYDEHKLLEVLTAWESLVAKTIWKPVLYLNYLQDLDGANEKAGAFKNKLIGRLSTAVNKIVFFELTIGKIKAAEQKRFLLSNVLSRFHHYLEVIFNQSEHYLGESEEQILNLKYLSSRGLWIDGQEKLHNQQVVVFEGKTMPLGEAFGKLPELPTQAKRAKLQALISEKLKSISYFAESEINALYTDKKVDDTLRNFEKPYSATILGYQNDERSIINLVETITENFEIAHRFYKLKAKLLKTKKLTFADRAASIGSQTKKISFEKGADIFSEALLRLDVPAFNDIFNEFLRKGQIDVLPQKGKRGGAYCSASTGMPTMVLLNYVNSLDSVYTLGHEMGHAIHGELSKEQSPLYQDPVISIAEVASTLFENFVFDEVFETLKPIEKVIALHDRLNDDISTIFRQIACFNFENELHMKVRNEGFVSKEEIAALHNKHMKAYLGPQVTIEKDDGYFFVSWSHIRNYFYVYSYAYGQIISKALYRKYKDDKSYMQEIEKFLKAGSSKSPEEIFREIGIDTAHPHFFKKGLESIEDGLDRLEELAKEVKLIK